MMGPCPLWSEEGELLPYLLEDTKVEEEGHVSGQPLRGPWKGKNEPRESLCF